MDAAAAHGIWIAGLARGVAPLERLLRAGAVHVANAAACLTQLSEGAHASQLEIVILRVAQDAIVSELGLLKEDPWFSDIPVLVLLPAYDDALMCACLRAGAFQCLVEPISDELCQAAVAAASASRLAAQQLSFDPQHLDKVALWFQTPTEAESAARFLAAFCPQPARQALGISELLLNAVEHGNLGIGGETKARLLTSGTFQEEVALRLRDPERASRRARVTLRRFADHIEICCQDEGNGFDWRRLANHQCDDGAAPRGRGIALSRKLAFDSLQYFGNGNRVAARVDFERLLEPKSMSEPISTGRSGRHEQAVADLSEAECQHIQAEAQRILQLEADDQVFHEEAMLAARLLGARKACLGLVNSDGRLLASLVDTCGERDVQLFESEERLPELWSRVLTLNSMLIVNEPQAVASFGIVQQSLLIPIRHRLAVIGFLHVADNGAEWSLLDARRLEVLALQLAPVLAVRISAEAAERRHALAAGEQARALEDQEAARYLVGCLLREGCMDEPGIRHLATSVDVFNGDIALAARLPGGGLRWMLGDFVGHGLSAAIGGIPLASVFYATAQKNVPIAEVVVTMNQMLRDVLPPGYFCAAVLLELCAGELRLWNGGMPPALLRRAASREVCELPSGDFPLGIVEGEALDLGVRSLRVEPGDRVLCYSDGLIETRNRDGALFGVERAVKAFAEVPADEAFEHLSHALADFRGIADVSDDLSIVEITAGLAERSSHIV